MKSDKIRQLLSWLMMISGGIAALLGLGLVWMYVLEGVIKRIGESDQSLLFWYLPLLLIGIIIAIVGAGLIFWGLKLRSKKC